MASDSTVLEVMRDEERRPYKLDVDEASVVLPDGAATVEVGASGTAGDVALDVVDVADEVPEVGGALACVGVEVEETNGGACWTYEPSAWTA